MTEQIRLIVLHFETGCSKQSFSEAAGSNVYIIFSISAWVCGKISMTAGGYIKTYNRKSDILVKTFCVPTFLFCPLPLCLPSSLSLRGAVIDVLLSQTVMRWGTLASCGVCVRVCWVYVCSTGRNLSDVNFSNWLWETHEACYSVACFMFLCVCMSCLLCLCVCDRVCDCLCVCIRWVFVTVRIMIPLLCSVQLLQWTESIATTMINSGSSCVSACTHTNTHM